MQFTLVCMARGSWRQCGTLKHSEGQLLCSWGQKSPLPSVMPCYIPLPPSFFSRKRKRMLHPKDVTACSWLLLIPCQGALERTIISKKLSMSLLHWGDAGINRTASCIIPLWCPPTLLSQAEHTNNGWLNPKYVSKATLASDRTTQRGAAITWMRVLKPGTGLCFPDASTVAPTLFIWLAPQLWSAFIQHFTNNISSPVQN